MLTRPLPAVAGRTRGARRAAWLLVAALGAAPAPAGSPFATGVVQYAPAPGQFVNVPAFNDPHRALGPPTGGGTFNPDNTSLVTLGGFGGSITLRFGRTVRDDATNPLGLDAIVFGNALWVGGHPNRRWAECAVIEISRDVNGNGVADDPWYVIPGSHLPNPAGAWQTQTWDDDLGDPTYPPTPPPGNPYPDWIPPGASGVWTTAGFRLPPAIFDVHILQNPLGLTAAREGVWGYADFTPTLLLGDLNADNVVDDPAITPAEFYTVPDDPLTVGISPGSGGGDAFDIAWAVDPATGQPAGLDGFDFIRITCAVNHVSPLFGELSTEIDAVADVRPGPGDLNCDGRLDFDDIDPFVLALGGVAGYAAAYPDCSHRNADLNADGRVDFDDVELFVARLTEGPP